MCTRGINYCLPGRQACGLNIMAIAFSCPSISYNLIKFRKIPLWFLNLKVIECELENWLQETLLKHCWDSELESWFNVCQHRPCLAYFIDYFATYGIYDYLMWKYSCDFRVYLMNWRTGERETLQKHCWVCVYNFISRSRSQSQSCYDWLIIQEDEIPHVPLTSKNIYRRNATANC